MTSVLLQTVEEIFCSAQLSIIPSDVPDDSSSKPTSSIVKLSDDIYSTSAYFRDASSKRAKVIVPVLIVFNNELERKKILKSGAIQPTPSEYDANEDDVEEENDREKNMWDAELELIGETQGDELENAGENDIKFLCACKDSEGIDCKRTVIEGIKILSTSLVDSGKRKGVGIRFDVEIAVRSLPVPTNIDSKKENNSELNGSNSNKLEVNLHKRTEADMSKTQLEVRATLVSTINKEEKVSYVRSPRHSTAVESAPAGRDIQLALQALDMGMLGFSPYETDGDLPTSSYFSQSLTYSLPAKSQKAPLLKLDILPALLVSVREVSGAATTTGVTLVSLVIYHSNVHNENVTITNIAVHPGHSRLCDDTVEFGEVRDAAVNGGKAMPGGENAVINMTKNVRWGYASGTAPSLPLVLKPQEAIATVIQINANEVMMERVFLSPICVRAVVGDTLETADSLGVNTVTDTFRNMKGKNTSMVMVSTDARWTTSPVAVGSSDAFRITLSIREAVCNVGAQVVVALKVTNLSSEPRDLMLIMAKDSDSEQNQIRASSSRDNLNGMSFAGGNMKSGTSTLGMSGASANNSSGETQQTQQTPIQNSVNNAVVYEVSGYTFGCWGLSGDDDGTIRYTRDHDLLAIDAALLLGEVKGHMSTEAELRFVPLREGTLSVPNLKLYDKIDGKWYDCYHTLKIISVAKQ